MTISLIQFANIGENRVSARRQKRLDANEWKATKTEENDSNLGEQQLEIDNLITEGKKHLEDGNYGEAISHLNGALALCEQDPVDNAEDSEQMKEIKILLADAGRADGRFEAGKTEENDSVEPAETGEASTEESNDDGEEKLGNEEPTAINDSAETVGNEVPSEETAGEVANEEAPKDDLEHGAVGEAEKNTTEAVESAEGKSIAGPHEYNDESGESKENEEVSEGLEAGAEEAGEKPVVTENDCRTSANDVSKNALKTASEEGEYSIGKIVQEMIAEGMSDESIVKALVAETEADPVSAQDYLDSIKQAKIVGA